MEGTLEGGNHIILEGDMEEIFLVGEVLNCCDFVHAELKFLKLPKSLEPMDLLDHVMFEVELFDEWALVETLDLLESVVGEVGDPQVDQELEILEVEEMLVAEVELLNLQLPVVREVDLLEELQTLGLKKVIGDPLTELFVLPLSILGARMGQIWEV